MGECFSPAFRISRTAGHWSDSKRRLNFNVITKIRGLKPHPQSCHESKLAPLAPFAPHQVFGSEQTPFVGDADVGRKLAPDFVTQAQPHFDVVEARSRGELFHFLDRGCGFETALQHQPLGEQQVSRPREAEGDIPS